MNTVKIIKPQKITLNRVEYPFFPINQRKVSNWWKEYNKVNPNLFNGDLVAFQDFTLTKNGHLSINWYLSNYAHYLLRNDTAIGVDYARAIYCSIILKTNSESVLVGQMSGNTSTPERLQLPGGNLDLGRKETIDDYDCINNAAKELKEETGVHLDVSQLKLWGVKMEGQFGDVGIIYTNKTPVEEAYILSCFDFHLKQHKENKSLPELSNILFINNNNFANIAAKHKVDYLQTILEDIFND